MPTLSYLQRVQDRRRQGQSDGGRAGTKGVQGQKTVK